MNIKKQYIEDHQVKLTIEIEDSPWEKAKYLAARRLSKQIKIPGFRPGKAPYKTVVRQIGEDRIVQTAIESIVDDIYTEAIEEAEIEPYGTGELEPIEEFDPPIFEFVISLMPKVELGDYKSIHIPYEPPKIDAEEIDEILEGIQKQHAVTKTLKRPAEDDDIIYMRVSAKRLDIEDEEEATLYDQQFSSARLGQKASATDRQFFPGFSEQLIGMSPEEEKIFAHTYPDDYEDKELQGVEVEFQIVVTNIQGYSLPDLDDEFAQKVSDLETLEELRKNITSNKQLQATNEYDTAYETQVIEEIIAKSTLAYPQQVIEDKKKSILANLEQRLSQQGVDKETYLQFRSVSEEEFDAETTTAAEYNAKREMILLEIGEVEEIQPDQDELKQIQTDAIDVATADLTPREIKALQKDGRMTNFTANITANMILQEVVNYLIAIAKIESTPEDDQQAGLGEAEVIPEAESSPEDAAPTPTPADAPTDEANSTSEEESEDA